MQTWSVHIAMKQPTLATQGRSSLKPASLSTDLPCNLLPNSQMLSPMVSLGQRTAMSSWDGLIYSYPSRYDRYVWLHHRITHKRSARNGRLVSNLTCARKLQDAEIHCLVCSCYFYVTCSSLASSAQRFDGVRLCMGGSPCESFISNGFGP